MHLCYKYVQSMTIPVQTCIFMNGNKDYVYWICIILLFIIRLEFCLWSVIFVLCLLLFRHSVKNRLRLPWNYLPLKWTSGKRSTSFTLKFNFNNYNYRNICSWLFPYYVMVRVCYEVTGSVYGVERK